MGGCISTETYTLQISYKKAYRAIPIYRDFSISLKIGRFKVFIIGCLTAPYNALNI